MTSPCSQGDPGDSTCPDSPFFSFGTRLGLVFIVEAASLSAVAVLGLLGYISYGFSKIKSNASRRWTAATHVHWYFLSLLISEVIQAIGGIIDIKWIAESRVTEGPICTAQGVLKQCGDVGVAFATLAIAIHTFCTLVFRWRPRQGSYLPLVVLAIIWLFLVLLVSLSLGTHRGDDYYGNTQYWCWITSKYPVQRIVLEYMWMWLAAFINFILYVPMALVIIYDRAVVIHGWRIHTTRNIGKQKFERRSERVLAMKMLVYPAVYTCTVLPIAITRWMQFTGGQVSWPGTVFSDVIFAFSGFLNVVLFTVTRPNLLPQRANSILIHTHTKSSPQSTNPSRSHSSDNSSSSPAVLDSMLDIRAISPTEYIPTDTQLHSLKRPRSNSFDLHSLQSQTNNKGNHGSLQEGAVYV